MAGGPYRSLDSVGDAEFADDMFDMALDGAFCDKKNRSGVRRFILPVKIGATVTVTNVTEAELLRGIEEMTLVGRADASHNSQKSSTR